MRLIIHTGHRMVNNNTRIHRKDLIDVKIFAFTTCVIIYGIHSVRPNDGIILNDLVG